MQIYIYQRFLFYQCSKYHNASPRHFPQKQIIYTENTAKIHIYLRGHRWRIKNRTSLFI